MTDVLQTIGFILGFIAVNCVAVVVCVLLDKAFRSSNKMINMILRIIYFALMVYVWVTAANIVDNIG